MRKVLLVLFSLLICLYAVSADKSIESLLKELDEVLLNDHQYIEQKEQRIDRLKLQLGQELSPERQYEISNLIIEEYRSYVSDSALAYIDKNIELAKRYNNPTWKIYSDLQYAFVLSASGLFVESEIILKNIPRDRLSDDLLLEYYKRMEMLYSNINTYQEGKHVVKNYGKIADAYRDSVYMFLPESSKERLFYNYMMANSKNAFDNAREYLEIYLALLHPGTHEHAKKSYSLSTLYRRMGNTEMHVKHLIMAVISDVKDAIKENRALLDLAIFLYEHNDVERAFRYIQHALSDANYYNTRFRYYEISKVLPIITHAYQEQNDRQSQRLQWLLIFLSVFFVIFLFLLLYLNKQMRVIRQTRAGMKKNNEDLERMNAKLNKLNQELSEANLVKEEYIGHFLDLCSEYIANLEEYKRMVNNKITAKRYDDLLKSSSVTGKGSDVKDLYINFDKAFLNIYPGFVSLLNNLLKEESRFEVKKGELLNTELRVFALIRLGITDSAKIASFLRCSVQTVYNYRSKIKRSSLTETDDIEEQIKQIGKLDLQL